MITVVAYGAALDLPYMADDYFHIPFVDTHSLPEMWQTAGGLYYFRPLSFSLWKIMYILLGGHNRVAQHLLNLLLHLSNGLMTAWLAGRLWPSSPSGETRIDWRRRYLSATLFLLYPLSYEAVPWIGSLVHPLVTTLILLALVSYVQLRTTGNRAWGALSLALSVLSPFAHENGTLIAPLIAALELTGPPSPEPMWRRLRRAALWLLPTLLWFVIWRQVPADRGIGSLALNLGPNLIRNSLYIVQGTAYPLTWLGGWVHNQLGVNEYVAAAVLSAIALSSAVFIQRSGRADQRSWLPWLWIGLAASPVVFFLDFWYVSAAPRMLMLASVGIAWLWTDVTLRIADGDHITFARQRLSTALAAVLGVAVLVQNYSFILNQMRIYELGGSALNQAVSTTVRANNAGKAAIFFNLPVWIASSNPTYPIGQEGVTFVFTPPSDQIWTIIALHTGYPVRMNAVRWDSIRKEMPYYVGVMGAAPDWASLSKSDGEIFVANYGPDRIAIELVGELAVPTPATAPLARFSDALALLHAAATINNARLQVDLIWQMQEPPSPDVTVFVHVLDTSGQLIAQADGDPLAGALPFAQWPAALIVRDVRTIDVSGDVTVQVGLYDRATGDRLTAASPGGVPFADNAMPISIQQVP